ncbi:MAG: helix-turn-helix domain-containing protein [Candidatus Latescibacteria bacterium]|nr:helix-turn-helix domain-containing protein [Candidatus Latescibacterota bacterium]
MAKSFKNLLQKMPEGRRDRVEDRVQEMLVEMALQEIRQNRNITQVQLADNLKLNQAAVSKMEHQSDMHISTLRRLLAAMGGRLKLVAEFPDEDVVINQFEPEGKPAKV